KIDSSLHVVGGVLGTASTSLAPGAVGYGSGSSTLTGDAARFHWDATNFRFGLGASVPLYQAQFLSQSGDADFANRGLAETVYNGGATSSPLLRLQTAGGTKSSPAIVANTMYAGTLGYEAWDGAQWLRIAQVGAHVVPGSTPAAGNVAAQWYVYDDPTGATDPYGGAGAPTALNVAGASVRIGYNPITPGTIGTTGGGSLIVYGGAGVSAFQDGPNIGAYRPGFNRFYVTNDSGQNNSRLIVQTDESAGASSVDALQFFNAQGVTHSGGLEYISSTGVAGYAPNTLDLFASD